MYVSHNFRLSGIILFSIYVEQQHHVCFWLSQFKDRILLSLLHISVTLSAKLCRQVVEIVALNNFCKQQTLEFTRVTQLTVADRPLAMSIAVRECPIINAHGFVLLCCVLFCLYHKFPVSLMIALLAPGQWSNNERIWVNWTGFKPQQDATKPESLYCIWKDYMSTQQTHYAIMTSLLHQNDVILT